MPGWLWALLAAGAATALAAAARIGAWWRGRAAARDHDELAARADQAEAQRDAAAGAASVAEARTEVLADHAARQDAADQAAQEVRDADATAGPEPFARIRALDERMRELAAAEDRASARPGEGGAPAVRDP